MTSDRHRGWFLRAAILTVTASLVLAACSGGTSESASAAAVAATDTPAPTATPTAAPTPSPTPPDVSAAFLKVISVPDFSGKAKLSGTFSSGAVTGDITGDFAGDGDDSSSTQILTAGTFKQVTDGVRVGDKRWTRTSPGPWLEDLPKPAGSGGKGLAQTLRDLGSVVDLGVETHAGKQLHHLQPARGNKVTADEVGFDIEGATDGAFTLDFYATDDGTPAIIAVTGSWTQGTGSTATKTALDVEYAFSDIGKPQTITAPTDVWVRYPSKVNGYTMAHPAGWTVKGAKGEDQYLLGGQPYVYVAKSAFKGTTETFVTELKKAYRKSFGVDPVSETATRLGGEPAVRLLYQFKNKAGVDVTFADDVLVHGGTGWETFVATQGGHDDVAVFDQFVSTFAFDK